MGPGLFIKDGGWNLVLNSDSHHNYDPYTSNGAGQSADGFGAHVGAGHPGNVFRGCRAWANTDDGFDLINAYSPVTIEYSWAWQHGYLPGTHTPLAAGNGNGIKAGGYGGKYVPDGVKHTSCATRSPSTTRWPASTPTIIRWRSTSSTTPPSATLSSSTCSASPRTAAPSTWVPCATTWRYPAGAALKVEGADSAFNSWDRAAPAGAVRFDSVAPSRLGRAAPAGRQPAGCAPCAPARSRAVIDRGVDVGLPYI
jgi:hypothetical protein